MSKKDNFNQAMFDMFGVGKDSAQDSVQGTASTAAALDTEMLDRNVVQFRASDGPDLKVLSLPVTYLAPGTRVEGILRSEGSVEIDGEFKGDIMAEGNVTLRTDVTGNITARNLKIEGCSLTGDARISDLVQLNSESSINGNVTAGTLSSGGTIIGDLDIQHNMSLEQGAKVVGNVSTGTMSITRGAIIRGSVETRGEDIE